MQTVFLGEYIKAKRVELGLTQEELCEGICEPMTLSRIENGKQTPSRNRINAILQRLGLPDDRYFALLSKNEAQIEALQKEILSCNVHLKREEGLKKIAEMEALIEPDDKVSRQFLLRSRAILGKLENGTVQPYPVEEKLTLLMEAIRLTVPGFELEEIGRHLYSFDEVKTINQIANIYSNYINEKANLIYEQLIRYIQNHYTNILQSAGLFPLVANSYARSLDIAKRYQESFDMAQLGMKACVQYGHYATLSKNLAIMAECSHFLGNDEASKKLYYQAYYTALSTGDRNATEVTRREMQEYFGIVPEY